MSTPRDPDPSKLFVSAIYAEREAMDRCLERISGRFGPADYSTRELGFDVTGYYVREMGEPLFRRFFAFRDLLDPGMLVEIKLFTNSLEEETAREGRRRVNLDPGFISLGNLVLATGKPVAHRPYLDHGIYADLTLVYQSGSFQALPWTYRDYADPAMISFLNRIRQAYKNDLKERGAAQAASMP